MTPTKLLSESLSAFIVRLEMAYVGLFFLYVALEGYWVLIHAGEKIENQST